MKLSYDYINPITGRKTVLLEGDRMMCVETGYHTFKGWNEMDQLDELFFQSSPDVVRNSRFVDDTGQIWYLITLFTDTIMLKPEYDQEYDQHSWVVNQFRDLYTDEVPGEKLQKQFKVGDHTYIQVLDPLCEKHFSDFSEALNEFDKLRLKENV